MPEPKDKPALIGLAPMDLHDYDRAIEKIGGAFRLSVLLQKRVRELVRGAVPLIEVGPQDSPIDIALKEVLSDKVALQPGDRVGVLSIAQAVAATEAEAEKAEEADEESSGKAGTKTATKKRAKKKAKA